VTVWRCEITISPRRHVATSALGFTYDAPMIERFTRLPTALRTKARWERLGDTKIPAMLVHPESSPHFPAPVVIWLHGRTARKEIDPGRYLRWMRSGIGACAIDLPGHGERFDEDLHKASRSFDVVKQAIGEIDVIIESLRSLNIFDLDRIGIGGMSAGGMAVLARLCRPHPFHCASVEATTGSWEHQRAAGREMFRQADVREVEALDPIRHLAGWREVPFQAIHAKFDEWGSIEGQAAFVQSLRRQYSDPDLIEFVQFDHTGAPGEHIGFGRFAAEAKDRQRDFLVRWLT
jgi:dienelactone hydrolase